MNRELNPVAARALARQALDDEAVFDTLVAQGAVESSLEDTAFCHRLAAPRRKYWPMVLAGVAAVAAGMLVFIVLQPASHPIPQPVEISKVALSGDLRPLLHSAPIFRDTDAASRPPQSDGAVTSVEDGVATVNLGSIDGLAQGTELPVSHGRIVITTVFRDHSRGAISSGATVHTNDRVPVPSAVHLGAILQQVDSLATRSDLTSARDVARNALTAGSPGETRQVLEKLASLDYQTGAADVAREHYQTAVNNFDQAPTASPAERAATLANYGALVLLNGDRGRAADLLQKALPLATDPALRSQIVNNIRLAKHP